MVNVLIVDDKKMSRDSIKGYLRNASNRYNLVAEISNSAKAELFCMQYKIDLIIMDVCTEDNEDGIDATRKIKKAYPNVKVVIVTGMTAVDLIERAKKSGADSFWYKESDEKELIDVIDRTVNGERVYPDGAPLVKIGTMLSSEITPTELKVLRLIAKGFSDLKIAQELNVTISAVRYHVTNLFEKTGYTSRVTLVADLINKDFIVPGL